MNRAGQALAPLAVGGWRVFGGALILLLALAWRRSSPRLTTREVGVLAVVGLVAYAWPYGIQPYLVVQHDHGFIGMTVALVPLFTILFSIPMLGILPTRRQVIGVAGGLVCMGVILLDGERRGIPPIDLVITLSVPASYAFGNMLIKRYVNHVSPLSMTLVSLGIASAALLGTAFLAEPYLAEIGLGAPEQPQGWTLAILSIVILATLGTGLAMLMFNYLVVHEGALFAGMVTYIVPLGAVTWSWLDDGHVTLMQLAALAGVLAMVALVQYGAAKPREIRAVQATGEPTPCRPPTPCAQEN